MLGLLAAVRREERAETFWAASVLLLVMLAHAMLETSRDALFLANIPARRLPWVYLAIAALALPAARLFGRHHGAQSVHLGLIAAQLAAGVGTSCFVFLVRQWEPWVFYALYIWGGLATTLIVVRFWLLLGDRYTASEAKRLFPFIASGAVLGTVIGFGVTSLLGRKLPAHDLLAVSAGVFLLSATASIALRRAAVRGAAGASQEPNAGDEVSFFESARIAIEHPYVRRLALVLLLSSVTATIGDFIFKTIVAHELPAWRIGSFLATTYFAFNATSLVLLWLVVNPLMRAIGVTTALALQPILLMAGGVWVVLSGGLAAAVALRAIDGSLRWSFSKTATELLFVPMPARLRNAVKALSDILAHRGGQALASLLILLVLSTSDSPRWLAVVVIVCAAAWMLAAMSLRAAYLHLFRTTLAEGSIQTRLDFPDLDVVSLESLIAALSSSDDARVVAAMDLLREKGRVHLIPPLILYHPSPPVVVQALELFTEARRQEALPIAKRLLAHPDAPVRAAALRARAVIAPDPHDLEQARQSACAVVAASATVALAARGWIPAEEASTDLVRRLDTGPKDLGLHVAQALVQHPVPACRPLLIRLAHDDDPRIRCAAVRAMGAAGDDSLAPELVACLGDRAVREAAREALLALGEPVLDQLGHALSNHELPRATRAHVPRTISRFLNQRAADMLLAQLLIETEGMVRYKILRGLGRMVARDPSLSLAPDVLDRVIAAHVQGLLQLLHWRVTLEQGPDERPEWRTTGLQLLVSLLHDKEALATERLFRLLGLRYPDEDLELIHNGLSGADSTTRSSSRELLDHMLSGDIRAAVMALADDVPDPQRLAAGHAFYQPERIDPATLIVTLTHARSLSIACLASFYATQIGLDGNAPADFTESPSSAFDRLRDHWLRAFPPAAAVDVITRPAAVPP